MAKAAVFERSAGHYLDMETLAMLGVGLTQMLTRHSDEPWRPAGRASPE